MLDRGVNHLPLCNGGSWAGLVDINDVLGERLPASVRVEHGLRDLRFVGDGTALIAAQLEDLTNKKVREVELHDLPTLDEGTPLLHRHVAPLPVLDDAGKFKGMLSRRTLLAPKPSSACRRCRCRSPLLS